MTASCFGHLSKLLIILYLVLAHWKANNQCEQLHENYSISALLAHEIPNLEYCDFTISFALKKSQWLGDWT
jgi:hypothetical protein